SRRMAGRARTVRRAPKDFVAASRATRARPGNPNRLAGGDGSGEYHVLHRLRLELLHLEQPAPPRELQFIEPCAARGGDGVNAECMLGLDRRRFIVAKKIHLGEDDAV